MTPDPPAAAATPTPRPPSETLAGMRDDLLDEHRDLLRRVERLRWFLALGWVVAVLWLLPAFLAAVR